MKSKKKISTERVYELIMEEHEYNPIVGTAFYETKEFLMSIGFKFQAACKAVVRVEQVYDLNLYRRPNGHNHSDNGDVLSREFGISRSRNKSQYSKVFTFYTKRLKAGMTKEQAIKEAHDHYDPILAKERAGEPQTEQIDIFTQQVKTLSSKNKDLSNLEIEF